MNKQQIRKQVLTLRDNLSQHERERGAVLLTERICGHQWFYRSDIILAFASYKSEIDTTQIIEEALRLGKKVYVPRVETENVIEAGNGQAGYGQPDSGKHQQKLVFYRIKSMAELVAGYKGIPEPLAIQAERYVYNPEDAERTLVLMPGAVFDKMRNRIGYGKGFYDRFLAEKDELQIRTIGVGFACQMVEALPAEAWDIKPYQVICI